MKAKNLIFSVITLGMLTLAGIYSVKSISAQEADNYPPIIQKLVERFGLNADEVKKVFEEEREEGRARNQEHFEERLDQAVEEGKITEEQKQAILDKHAEMQAKHESLKDLSFEERQEALKTMREEMQAWAEENGLDPQQFPLMPGPKGFGERHLGPKS